MSESKKKPESKRDRSYGESKVTSRKRANAMTQSELDSLIERSWSTKLPEGLPLRDLIKKIKKSKDPAVQIMYHNLENRLSSDEVDPEACNDYWKKQILAENAPRDNPIPLWIRLPPDELLEKGNEYCKTIKTRHGKCYRNGYGADGRRKRELGEPYGKCENREANTFLADNAPTWASSVYYRGGSIKKSKKRRKSRKAKKKKHRRRTRRRSRRHTRRHTRRRRRR